MTVKKIKKPKKGAPTNSNLKRPKEFEVFAKWLAISPLLKLLSERELEKIGVDDSEELWLLKIKTQADFAKKFKIGPDTLSEWKSLRGLWELVDAFKKQWGKSKTPSILAGFYRKAVSEGDAARVKLWLQYFEDWIPEEKTKLGFGDERVESVEIKIRRK
jgi:hypothetical protein